MADGELCTACWAGTLHLHEGMMVCAVCGNIQQGFAEETQEFQAGVSDARFFKKSEGMKSKAAERLAAAAEPQPPAPVAEAVQAYVRAIQQLLQNQAHVLATQFGLDPELPTVLREVWLTFLTHSRVLEPATTIKLEALAEQGTIGGRDDGSDSEGGAALHSQMTYDRRSLRIQAELAPALHLRHTLALLLVGCWVLHEAVSPLDILRWALDGQLPYLSFAVAEGAPLADFRGILGRSLCNPKGVPSPSALYQQASQLAEEVSIACPPLNPALWLQRYLSELELPQELLHLTLQLHTLYQAAPMVPAQAARFDWHPWALLMASVVLAVKLCYGLDGSLPRVPGRLSAPAWHEWAPRQLSRLCNISAFPLSINEVLQLDERSLRAYLQYLQRGLFSSCAPPAELEMVHRLLKAMGMLEEDGKRNGQSTAQLASQQDCQLRQIMQEDDDRTQQQSLGQQGSAQQDLQHAGHAYIVCGSAWHHSLLHPDYVLVLTACAALVWLAPEGLHQVVARLEQRMIGSECEISSAYNSEEQARWARASEEWVDGEWGL